MPKVKRYLCRKGCGKSYADGKGRQYHEENAHTTEVFQCRVDKCPKTFGTDKKRTRHEKGHLPEEQREFQCRKQGCKKGFTTYGSRARHERGHKKYQCKVCSWNFDTEEAFARHGHPDTPDGQFSCRFPGCDKKFSALWNMLVHVETHDPERIRYACRFCEKDFAFETGRTEHEKSHDEERAYKCRYEDCGKVLSCKNALEDHEYLHETTLAERQEFECRSCDKIFTKAPARDAHEQVHTLTQKCPVCDEEESFTNCVDLVIHMKDFHPAEHDSNVYSVPLPFLRPAIPAFKFQRHKDQIPCEDDVDENDDLYEISSVCQDSPFKDLS